MNVNTNMHSVSPLLLFYWSSFLNVIIINFGLKGFSLHAHDTSFLGTSFLHHLLRFPSFLFGFLACTYTLYVGLAMWSTKFRDKVRKIRYVRKHNESCFIAFRWRIWQIVSSQYAVRPPSMVPGYQFMDLCNSFGI